MYIVHRTHEVVRIFTLMVAWFSISCQARSMGEGDDGTGPSLLVDDSWDSAMRIISFDAICWLLALSNLAAALLDKSWI